MPGAKVNTYIGKNLKVNSHRQSLAGGEQSGHCSGYFRASGSSYHSESQDVGLRKICCLLLDLKLTDAVQHHAMTKYVVMAQPSALCKLEDSDE
jgi:hypothetical protein